MDPLKDALLAREAQSAPKSDKAVVQSGGGNPTVTPSKPSHVPPAWQRWLVSQKMQQAYANGWQPNPMLIQALASK